MWKEIKATTNLLPCLQFFCSNEFIYALNQGYIISGKKLYDPKKFSEVKLEGADNITSIKVTENYIYISNNSKIYELTTSIDNINLKKISCVTKKEKLSLLNDLFFTGVTRIITNKKRPWIDQTFETELIRRSDCKIVYKWTDPKFYPFIQRKGLYLLNKELHLFQQEGNFIFRLDLDDDAKELWKFEYNDDRSSGWRYTQLVDDILVISLGFNDDFDRPDHNHLVGLDINTGKIKWKLDEGLIYPWYQFDNKIKKLFTVAGFENVIYQVIDPLTGTKEVEKNLSQTHKNIEVNCHNVFLGDDYLYFSSNTRTPYENADLDYDYLQPQVGTINTKTHELEYLQDIDVDMKKIDRPSNALGIPVVHKNRMYVMDSGNNLHILEKE